VAVSVDDDEEGDLDLVDLVEYEVDPAWSCALPDWKERIKSGRSLIADLPLDQTRADKALRLFKQLVMPDIVGRPTYGASCDQFIFDLVRAIFGAFDPVTKARMIREYFLLIPKKNGKTSIAAAIMVVAMIMNERPDAELVLIAPTIKIARRSFKQACGIIQHTVLRSGVALETLFSMHASDRVIKFLNPAMPSELVILAADTDTVTGSKASYVLIDETHEFASKPRANEVFIELRGGLSHESNTGFMMQITTQSKKPPAGVFKSELRRARDVRDGKLSYPMLPILYELPPELARDGGWKRRETWRMVNPHLGRSVKETFLIEQLSAAEADGKDALALLASQHFNVEVGMGNFSDRWVGADFWEQAARPKLDLAEILANSDVVICGGDGGGMDDLMAICFIGRHRETRVLQVWVHAWADDVVLEQRKSIAAQLLDFAKQGDLTIGGEIDHLDMVVDYVKPVFEAGLFPEKMGLGFDAYGMDLLLDRLEMAGLPADLPIFVGQGYKLQPSIKNIPVLLKAGLMVHCDQPILNWSVGNAKAIIKNNNTLITKEAAGVAKIDPLMALFDAYSLMRLNPEASGTGSYLDTEELMVF
jgi:phage terminase large subunit-like protein